MKRIIFTFALLLIFSLFVFIDYTTSTNESDSLDARVESSDRVMLFNDYQEFVDDNDVSIEVFAPKNFDGWYVGNCYVTGVLEIVDLDKRAEGFLGNGGDTYYLGGAFDGAVAMLQFRDHPNVRVPGSGWGWCRIQGFNTNLDNSPGGEAECSQGFTFDFNESDLTPNCDACIDASPDCPQAGNRHFWSDENSDSEDNDGNDDGNGENNDSLGISPTNPDQVPIPGNSYEVKVVTDSDFYSIQLYVKRSGESGSGEAGDYVYGGNSDTTEATLSHTFPSVGDYVLTAVITRESDMSDYDETYSLRVDYP